MNYKQAEQHLRSAVDHSLDALQMLSYNEGFEAAADALDELAEVQFNEYKPMASEVLSWAARELRGENA